MKIPWTPVTEGAGAFGPVKPTKSFLENYMTAMNPVSHKAFQNLPMNTEAPAVIVVKQNKDKKPLPQSTKVREGGEGAGENYVDSFVTHPVKGNYEAIVRNLEITREMTQKALRETNYTTLGEVAEWGYRDLGANADEERMNSLRDRLRFAGASDEEIESILKERKKERLLAAVSLPLSEEQRQVLQAEEMARRAMGAGALRADAANPLAARPPADANVFNFGVPGAGAYAAFNPVAVPGNEIFAGAARAGINLPGRGGAPAQMREIRSQRIPTIEVETPGAAAMREGRLPRGLMPIGEQVAVVGRGPVVGQPPVLGEPARQQRRFPMMRPVQIPESILTRMRGDMVSRAMAVAGAGAIVPRSAYPRAAEEAFQALPEELQEMVARRGARGRPRGSRDTAPRSRPSGLKYKKKGEE